MKDIGDPANLQTLKWVFTDPDKLKPLKSNAAITREAAEEFAKLAKAMRDRSVDPQQAAHFLAQCIFCMFAEDKGLLHDSPTDNAEIFSRLLKAARNSPDKAADRINKLFTAMQKKGGVYGDDDIAWFNGGLFKTIDIPTLTESDLNILYDAADSIDWRAIDPTIFGTLFERGLDPNCRAQLGTHYTDVATINKLIEPLITRLLAGEWEAAKAKIAPLIAKSGKTTTGKNVKTAANLYHGYLERLRNFRVLDATCGSENFLYLALHALKDLEHRAQIDAETPGFPKQIDQRESIGGRRSVCGAGSRHHCQRCPTPTRPSHCRSGLQAQSIARKLAESPPEWVDWVITPEEEKAGFPKRAVAKAGHEAELKKRTLTNLYNTKPAWLVNAHQTLDKAVANAYGWDDYTPEISDAEILQRLLKLNLQRANDPKIETQSEPDHG